MLDMIECIWNKRIKVTLNFEFESDVIFIDKKTISNLLTIAGIGLLLSATMFICFCRRKE